MKKTTIHQPEHLPWLGFIHKVMSADELVLLDDVQFEKNYFQNRNKIRTNEGWQWLTVPIKKHSLDTLIKDIKISYDFDWQSDYLKALEFNYRKAKYFANYYPEIKEIILRNYELLADLNYELIKSILKSFHINIKIVISSELNFLSKPKGGSERCLEICKVLNTDIYLSGSFGKDYLDVSMFKKENIKVEYHKFNHPVYRQVYDSFIPNMSSIDLLFNYGPDSLSIIA